MTITNQVSLKAIKNMIKQYFKSKYVIRKLKKETDGDMWIWYTTVDIVAEDFEQFSRIKKLLKGKWSDTPAIDMVGSQVRLRYWNKPYTIQVDIFISEEQFLEDYPSCSIEETEKIKRRVVCGLV